MFSFETKKYGTDYTKAFTLIELVVTLVLLTSLSIVIITYFSGFYALKLDAASNKLASDIRHIQQLSITKQDNFGIYFDTGNNSYTLFQNNISNIITDPLTKTSFIVDYSSDNKLEGVNLVSVNFTGNTLKFNPLGEPLDSTDSNITYVGQINLTYENESKTISVEKNTGKVWIE